ncbi:MAG: NAD(P)/FAD-dependent oxidoreductase [Paracoccaceae bacterium]|nr:NAD(P)/FAD-dependent oxidoreductase [Paracoccaceae bacterium]
MKYDTLIIGAGAAGMMCAAHTKGRVLVIDHTKAPGEKIRISGGGRCNFTNLHTTSENFLSQNRHFCKSALGRYTQWNFIEMVEKHRITYHEKTLGQLFCDDSAKQIITMLRDEMDRAKAELCLRCSVAALNKTESGFEVTLEQDGQSSVVSSTHLVVATGGKSIPKMGATNFAYEIAKKFNIAVTETRAALVPLTFSDELFKPLAGTALPARVGNSNASFDEGVLFTHRGLSGPSILQISSFWREGETIFVNLIPNLPLLNLLSSQRQEQGRRNLTTVLAQYLPARLIEFLSEPLALSGNLANQSDARLSELCEALSAWSLTPSGSEGYRTAEVTLGGIDTDTLSSKTLMCKTVPGLYFIGEAVDVTGWLGGYNFQWAWSSGWAAAQAIAGD